jgi:hypothetical protein
MEDQVLIRMFCHAPIQAPFKKRKCLRQRQWFEWDPTVKEKQHLRPEPTAQVSWSCEAYVKVHEC